MHSEGKFFMRHDHIMLPRMRCFFEDSRKCLNICFETRLVINYNHMHNLAPFFLLSIAWRHIMPITYVGSAWTWRRIFLYPLCCHVSRLYFYFLKSVIFIIFGWVVFRHTCFKGIFDCDRYLNLHYLFLLILKCITFNN